jgi:hypothetical protein
MGRNEEGRNMRSSKEEARRDGFRKNVFGSWWRNADSGFRIE